MYKKGEIVTVVTLLVIGIVTMGSVLMGKLSVLPKSTSTRALTCTDTDQGKNYATKGTTKDSSGTSITDYCSGSRTLYETYCNQNGYASYESVDCDKGCGEGICLGSANSPTATPPQAPPQEGAPTLTPPPTQQGKSFSLNYHTFSCTSDNKIPPSVTANIHICQGISDKAYYYATGVSTGTLGTKRRDRFVVDPQCDNIVYDIPLKSSWLTSSEKDDVLSLYYNFNNQTAFSGKVDFKITKPVCGTSPPPQVSTSPSPTIEPDTQTVTFRFIVVNSPANPTVHIKRIIYTIQKWTGSGWTIFQTVPQSPLEGNVNDTAGSGTTWSKYVPMTNFKKDERYRVATTTLMYSFEGETGERSFFYPPADSDFGLITPFEISGSSVEIPYRITQLQISSTPAPIPSAPLRASPTPTQVVNRVNVNYALTVTNPDPKYYVKVTNYTGLAGEGEKECGRFDLVSGTSKQFNGTCYNLVSGRGYTVTAMIYDKTTNQSPNFSLRDSKDITTPSQAVALNLNLNPPTLTPTPQGGKDLPVTINVTDPNNNFNLKVFSQEDGSTPKTCFSMPGDSTSGGGPCGSLVAGRNYTVYVKLYNLSGGEVAFGANSVTSKQFTLPTGSFSVLFDKIFMPVDLKAPVNLRASCTNPTGPMSFTWSNTSSVSIAKNQIARYSYGGNPWNYDFGKVAGSATAFSDIYASYSHTYRYMVRSCGDDACTKVSAWSGNTGDVICPAPTSTPTPTRTPTPSPTPTPTFTPVPTIVASANLPTITDFSANEQTMGQSGEIPKCGVVKMYWKTPPPSEISVDGWEMNFYNSSGLQATRFIPVGATCYGCDSGAGSEKWQAEVPDVNLNAGEKCIFMAPPSYSDTDSGAHVSLRAVKGNEKGQETVSNNFYASSIQRVWYSNDPTPVILGTCKQQCGDFDNRSICTDQGGVCSSAANCQPTEIFSGYCGRQGNTDWGACCKAIEPPTPTRTALTPSPSNGPTQLAIRGRIDINQDAAELDIFIFRHMGEMNVELMRDRTIQYKDVKLGQSKNYEFTNLPSDSTYEVLPLYFTQIPTDGRLNHIEKLLGVLSMRVAVFAREPESPAGVEMEITLCSGEVVLRFNHKRCSMLLDNQQGTNLRANFTVPSVPRALDFYIPHRNASFSINQGVKDAITCYIKKRFRPSHTIEAVRSDWDAMVQGAISGGWNSAFVTALWIEESGGTTSLGCISEPGTVADQIACINSTPASYKSPDEKGFDEFMCRWSGEPRPAPPDTRSCLIPFINNANFLPVIKDWYFNGTALSSVDQLPSFIKNCQ